MTHPTKAIYYTLLSDFAKLAADNADTVLFTKADVDATMDKIEVVDFDQTIEVKGIKVSLGGRGGGQCREARRAVLTDVCVCAFVWRGRMYH